MPHALPSLRTLLLVDAAGCVIMAGALTLDSGFLGDATQIPPDLLHAAGIVLLPIAVFMGIVAIDRAVALAAARLIVLGNIGWVAASLLLAASGLIDPNPLDLAFLLTQALAVAGLAILEHVGLRQAMPGLRTG